MTKSKARYIRLPVSKQVFHYMAPVCEHCGCLILAAYVMRKTGYRLRPDTVVFWCEKCAEGPDAVPYEQEVNHG